MIPKGEYGGGTVMLWDRGTWAPIRARAAKDIDEGHLHFTLEGERMKGEWVLFRLKPRPGEKRENWLLRKVDDAYAGGPTSWSSASLTSVNTEPHDGRDRGRRGRRAVARGHARARPSRSRCWPPRRTTRRSPKAPAPTGKPPKFRPPQLATLVDAVPAGNGWLHEIKYDGYRALDRRRRDDGAVYTRNGLDWTDKFAPLVAPHRRARSSALPDRRRDRRLRRQRQSRLLLAAGRPETRPWRAGRGDRADLLRLRPARARRQDLAKLANHRAQGAARRAARRGRAADRFADHVIGTGEKLFDAMCGPARGHHLETHRRALSRRADARTGSRSNAPGGRNSSSSAGTRQRQGRAASASLLLARARATRLVYAGKVGTGFDADAMRRPREEIRNRANARPPRSTSMRVAARGVALDRSPSWSPKSPSPNSPRTVVRHASFLGLREDKEAKDVKPETKQAAPAPAKRCHDQQPRPRHLPRSQGDQGRARRLLCRDRPA